MAKDGKGKLKIAETVLNPANTTESLRATVPSAVVSMFEMKKGDKLVWEIYADEKEVILKVKPKRENK